MSQDQVRKRRRQVFTSAIQVCAALVFCSSVGCSNGASTDPAVPSPADTSNELESMQSNQHTHPVASGAHVDDTNALHCEVAVDHAAADHGASEHVSGEHLLHCEHIASEPVAGDDAHALSCEPVAGAHVASDHAAGEQVHEVYLHCVHHVEGEQAHEVHLHCQHFTDEHALGDQVHDAHVLHCEHVTG